MKKTHKNKHPKALAVKLQDGQVIVDHEVALHAEILAKWNLCPENVVDSGFKMGSQFHWRKKKPDRRASTAIHPSPSPCKSRRVTSQ